MKRHVSLVVIGHVDSGKSTTTGHLVFKCGGIDKRVIAKLKKKAVELNKPSFAFAFVMDNLKAEQDRGITIDISLLKFETKSTMFTMIDAPGHRDFIKNMITGTAQADVAILMISAKKGEFEAGYKKDGQTREHALLAYTLGIKQVIVCVNKMDSTGFSKQRYDEIKQEVRTYLTKRIGFKSKNMTFVPVSGLAGDNLTTKTTKMSWFKGPTLIEALEAVQTPARPVAKPLRLPIQAVYKIGGVGTVPSGRVETGVLLPGQLVKFAPGGVQTEVKSVQMHHQRVTKAQPGDNVGFCVRNVPAKALKAGMVCGDAKKDPPSTCKSFQAQIIVFAHKNGVRKNYTPVVSCHTAHVACKFSKLHSKFNKKSGAVTEKDPEFIKSGEGGLVTMTPIKPMCVETAATYPALARFCVRDSSRTVAVGVIKKVDNVGSESGVSKSPAAAAVKSSEQKSSKSKGKAVEKSSSDKA